MTLMKGVRVSSALDRPVGTTRPLRYLLLICLAPLLLICRQGGPETPAAPITLIVNVGSDTMVNLALAWAEAYHELRPEITISVNGGGSGTGIAAMINGSTDIANASREITAEELQEAALRGIAPVEHIVALDAIAIVVNPHNPVDDLTFAQISDIYTARITNWKEVGGEDRPIILLSRESNSGTYAYFLEHVVRKGDKNNNDLFSPETLLLPSSEVIGLEIAHNPNAIGYDGLGYVTPEMKPVHVAVSSAGPFVPPTIDTVKDGSYPVARPLYMYTNGTPTGPIKDYLDWIMTTDGQAIVARLGFVPLEGF